MLNLLKTKNNSAAVFSKGIMRILHLKAFLNIDACIYKPTNNQTNQIDFVIGWGNKKNTAQAKQYAAQNSLPYLRLEDGFLRSVELGVNGAAPLSLIIDDLGIYYDATCPSLLENILNQTNPEKDLLLNKTLLKRAANCILQIVKYKLSKYNNSRADKKIFLKDRSPKDSSAEDSSLANRILVIDQTKGDISIIKGMVPDNGFDKMLQAALTENPTAEIIVKTHPDVLCGKKQGCINLNTKNPRITVISKFVNPILLIEKVDKVYTATSQMGFEALMAGKPVTCFGAPFYAGWGLTDDRVKIKRRTQTRSLQELFAAAYILYPQYINPEDGSRCEIETVIAHLQMQRSYFEQNAGELFCVGFSLWKQNYIRSYLKSPKNNIHFIKTAKKALKKGFNSNSKLIVWGVRENKQIENLAKQANVSIWRMEDGFLRSVGLGSDLTYPASLVVDTNGIYYNPQKTSDLEIILQNHNFSNNELLRAQKLRKKIIAARVSKYNVGNNYQLKLPSDIKKTIVLVPGQVEDDSSIQLGCIDIKTNADLLKAARKAKPDAYIIFKPHPDVISGNRKGAVPESITKEICDLVIEEAPLVQCLDIADEVHTMSSLVGFEALIRNISVTVYGCPFYSGWGLTNDRHAIKRRVRTLGLDELVAGVLIKYPRYINAKTKSFTSPEAIVALLETQRTTQKTSIKSLWHVRQFRKLAHVWRGIFSAK